MQNRTINNQSLRRLSPVLTWAISTVIAIVLSTGAYTALNNERLLRLSLEKESAIDDGLHLKSEIESKFIQLQTIPFTIRAELNRNNFQLSSVQFAELISQLTDNQAHIQSVLLIQNNLISEAFPNSFIPFQTKQTLSPENPLHRHYFESLKQQHSLIFGPTLIDGNSILSISTPIYTQGEAWGGIIILLDWNKLTQTPSHTAIKQLFHTSILPLDQTPDKLNLADQPVFIELNLLEQPWELEITPKQQWNNQHPSVYQYSISAIIGIIVFFLVFYWLIQNSALKKQRNTALEAVKEKNRFLSYAAHDLRQPLSALSYSIEELFRQHPNELDSKLKQNIINSSNNLNELFDQLLDVEQINNQKKVANLSSCNLKQVLNDLSTELESIFEEHNISILCHSQECYSHTDPVLLKRILRNIMINALESTSKGYVAITCTTKTNTEAKTDNKPITIQIRDTGQGIDNEDLEKIFSTFYRPSNKHKHLSLGIGAGLSIVKNYCELLDIDIELDSKPEEGTIFTLHLNQTEKPKDTTTDKIKTTHILPNPLHQARIAVCGIAPQFESIMNSWEVQLTTLNKDTHSLDSAETLNIINDHPIFICHANCLPTEHGKLKSLNQASLIIMGDNRQLALLKTNTQNVANIQLISETILPVRLRALLIQELSAR